MEMAPRRQPVEPSDGFFTAVPGPSSAMTMSRTQPIAKPAPSSQGDDLAGIIKKEVDERKAEISELREEEAEVKEKVERVKERNKILAAQLQKMKDELAALKRTVAVQKSVPTVGSSMYKVSPPMNTSYEDQMAQPRRAANPPRPAVTVQSSVSNMKRPQIAR